MKSLKTVIIVSGRLAEVIIPQILSLDMLKDKVKLVIFCGYRAKYLPLQEQNPELVHAVCNTIP